MSKNGKVEEVKDWIDDLEEDPIIPDKISGMFELKEHENKYFLIIRDKFGGARLVKELSKFEYDCAKECVYEQKR